MKIIDLDSNYYARLECYVKLGCALQSGGKKVIIIPDGITTIQELAELLLREGIAHYQTEVAHLDLEEKELEERKRNLQHCLEYEPDNYNGRPILVGPSDYLAALDSLDGLIRLRENIRKEISKLQAQTPEQVIKFLEGFQLLNQDSLAADTVLLAAADERETEYSYLIRLIKGPSMEPTPEAQLAARRSPEHQGPFLKYRKEANQRAKELHFEHLEKIWRMSADLVVDTYTGSAIIGYPGVPGSPGAGHHDVPYNKKVEYLKATRDNLLKAYTQIQEQLTKESG